MNTLFRVGLLLILSALALGIVLGAPIPSSANAGPSQSSPNLGGLVVPSTTSEVRIDRERLTFDLTQAPAESRVKAAYELVNVTGKEVALDLVFVAPAGRDFAAHFNGTRIFVTETTKFEIPPQWVSAAVIDPISGGEYALDSSGKGRPDTTWTFRLSMGPNARGTLEAEYRADLGFDRRRHEYIVRSLTYVLGPAKNWAGFGTLEVSVVAPAKYVLAASPAIPRQGQDKEVVRYGATFQGVPADLLRISTISAAAVTPPDPMEKYRVPAALGLPIVAAVIICLLLKGLLVRLPWPAVAAVLAGILAFVATEGAAWAVVSTLVMDDPYAAERSAGYEQMLEIIAWGLWSFGLLPILTTIATAVLTATGARRRAVA